MLFESLRLLANSICELWFCSSSSASSTRSSAYIIVSITCPLLKSHNPSRAPLIRYFLYKLNKLGDRQHPCPTYILFCTLLCFLVPFILNILIHVQFADQPVSHQSKPVLFRICICSNLHSQMPSVSLWSMHTLPCLCPQFILYSQQPSSIASFSSKSKLIFSKYVLSFLFCPFLSFLTTLFAACALW